MTADSAVLDVGCGYGRLALGILHATDFRGYYLGFDISGPDRVVPGGDRAGASSTSTSATLATTRMGDRADGGGLPGPQRRHRRLCPVQRVHYLYRADIGGISGRTGAFVRKHGHHVVPVRRGAPGAGTSPAATYPMVTPTRSPATPRRASRSGRSPMRRARSGRWSGRPGIECASPSSGARGRASRAGPSRTSWCCAGPRPTRSSTRSRGGPASAVRARIAGRRAAGRARRGVAWSRTQVRARATAGSGACSGRDARR